MANLAQPRAERRMRREGEKRVFSMPGIIIISWFPSALI
jgi:hypothetical protein